MEFKFRSFKKPEFESLLFNFIHDNNIHNPGQIVRYDFEANNCTAIIEQRLIDKLNNEIISELSNIH